MKLIFWQKTIINLLSSNGYPSSVSYNDINENDIMSWYNVWTVDISYECVFGRADYFCRLQFCNFLDNGLQEHFPTRYCVLLWIKDRKLLIFQCLDADDEFSFIAIALRRRPNKLLSWIIIFCCFVFLNIRIEWIYLYISIHRQIHTINLIHFSYGWTLLRIMNTFLILVKMEVTVKRTFSK